MQPSAVCRRHRGRAPGEIRGGYGLLRADLQEPLHEHWLVQVWEPRLYDLAWLSDYLDLSSYNGRKSLPEYGLGRNCTLFEKTRLWAYKAIRQGWPDYPEWLAACVDRASGYNAQFEQPLPANEVRHTAKSIAKWTHQHLSPAGFREEQARRGAKGGKVSKGGGRPSNSGKDKSDLLPEVLRLKAQGYTNRDIADDLGEHKKYWGSVSYAAIAGPFPSL
uniref:Primase C-terminal 1 domain-containing protein n=1 Tax=Escherichia coli TaxID=562 RepID=A0A2S0NSR9_ECOLX|nr:hypothetical protein [Escherichia coli]